MGGLHIKEQAASVAFGKKVSNNDWALMLGKIPGTRLPSRRRSIMMLELCKVHTCWMWCGDPLTFVH